MNKLMTGQYAGATANMVENLRQEFVDDTADRLLAFNGSDSVAPDIEALRRFAFGVKGEAHNFGLSVLEITAQRLEGYLDNIGEADARARRDIREFLDRMQDILDGNTPADADAALLVRDLPARQADFDIDEIEVRSVEVMLVMLRGAQTHFVEREMQQCGYRISIVTNSFEAFEHAVRTKPDFVVISAVMRGLSGIDLAIALSHMPMTRNIPVAVITSLSSDDNSLKMLPQTVPIIHKSDTFGDDLAEALAHHFLL